MTAVARVLRWDGEHFGVGVGRLERARLDEAAGRELVRWMHEHQVDCVYCLFDGTDAESPRVAERLGARFTDVRLTYALDAISKTRPPAGVGTRLARVEDLPALEQIAASAHRDSRFYFDGAFDEARVDELYRVWIRRSVAGPLAAGAVTLDVDGEAAGYVTFSSVEAGVGELGLVAVAERARGRGVAQTLVAAALEELASRGATAARVVTQGRNAAAQRLYQRAGFTTREVAVWFHLWRDPLRGDWAPAGEIPAQNA